MAAEDQDFVVLNAGDIQGFNEKGILPLPTEKILKIQKWLSPTDYKAPSSEFNKHCASHLASTGTWIFQTDQYQQWHNAEKGALWIKAIAGAGKSVIAATVTSKLATEENVPVLYFFFRHIISANQKPQSLVRDYLSQILEYSPELQHSLYKLVENQRSLDSMSFDEMWKMLVSALARFPRVYCVVDALDEMDVGNEFFLHNIIALAEEDTTAIKVLMTSRPVPRVEQVLRHPCVLQIALEPQLVHPDISIYVRHRVSKCDISENIRTQIHEKMCARADGHFLYARLMMDDLLEPSKKLLSRENELLSALNRLPTPMADMYTQMLLDHSQRSAVPQELQLTLLQWVTGSERPLRLLELSSMIDFKQSYLNMSKETKSTVREGCGPLLEILEDETVCPIHHSFTEYLYDSGRQYINSEAATFPVLGYKEAQQAIAITCIKYLASGWYRNWQNVVENNQSFNQECKLRSMKMKYPFLNYAANNWYKHVRKSGVKDATMASELDAFLLKDPEVLHAWLELSVERKSEFDAPRPKLFKTWKPLHVAAARGISFYVEYLIEKGHDTEALDLEQHTPLALAAFNGHDEVVAALLKSGAHSDEADEVGLKPMHHAASRNHHGVVTVLLEAGVDPFTPKTKEYPGRRCGNARSSVGDTAVEYCCQNGHVETINAFVPYLKADAIQKALSWAIKYGQTKVAMALIEVPSIDVNYVIDNQTPLYLASAAGDVELMRLLLNMGANAHTLSRKSHSSNFYSMWEYQAQYNPLQAFAKRHARGHGRIDWDVALMNNGFKLLLDTGLDPNTVDPDGLTILHDIMGPNNSIFYQGVTCGVEKTLSLLLDRGLSAISLTSDGSNALHLASRVSTVVIDILISHGVDINQIRKSDGKTPLMAVLNRNSLDIAQYLLDRGADANLADSDGNTPLHLLAKIPSYQLNQSSLDIIKALIVAGGDVNGRNKDGNTPMHLGVHELSPKLLSTFLEHGFDLEGKNKKGQTILFDLISKWRTGEHYRTLIEAGASPLTRDSQGSTILHAILGDIRDIGTKTTALLRYFVEKGVDPLSVDNFDNTLWHVAARLGADHHQQEQLAVMNLLVEFGVPPMARNNIGQTPLHVAFSVNRNHYPYGPIEFLLEHTDADFNVADYDKIRPIHLTSSSDPDLTCYLLDLGADPTVKTVEGQSPLMVACRTRQCNIVCILLDHYKEHGQLSLIDEIDNQGRSALHYACKSGRPEIVALLLDAGANVNLKDKKEFTPLDMCAEYLDEQASWDKARVADQIHLPTKTKAAYVLLTDLSRPNSIDLQRDPIRIRETVRLLIARGADTSFLTTKKDYLPNFSARTSGSNPLSYSIGRGCEAMVSELLIIQNRLLQARLSQCERNTIDIDEPSNEVKEEIDSIKKHWACTLNSYSNQVRFLKMRLMPEIMVKNIKPGENNMSVIQQLLREDDEPSVEEASRLGAKFLELENGGENPLYQMASWGFTDLMRNIGQDAARMNTAWIKEKAPLNVNWNEGRLKTILLTALTREISNLAMIKLLVSEFKLNPNELLSGGNYPIHIIAHPYYWWQTKALDFLLENGANTEVLNSIQETPLITALQPSFGNVYSPARVKAVEILLLHGANPNAIDKNGLTCLNIAAGQPSCIKLLLKYGANPSLGLRPFIFDAILAQDLDTLQIIVDSGADVNVLAQQTTESEVEDSDEDTYEWTGSDRQRRKDTFRRWSRISDSKELSKYAYPIHVAASNFPGNKSDCTEKAIKITKLLLGAGADPTLFYEDGTSILHVLAEQGSILEPFFHHPSFDTESRDHRGRTLLLAACTSQCNRSHSYDTTLISHLLKHGASLNAVDYNGCNALHLLISAFSQRKDTTHSTFLSVSEPIMPILTTRPNLQGRTPFHYAISASRFDLIDLLISHGADPLLPDPLDGSTALHHLAASLTKHKDTLLHDPRLIMSAEDISNLLTEPTCDPPADDNDLLQIVHIKCFTPESLARAQLRSPRRHIVSLLARGLSIDSRNHAGETPLFKLMTATLHNHYTNNDMIFPALKVFEDAGADFRARNNIGESALHKLATQVPQKNYYMRTNERGSDKDLRETFQWLVEKGIDVSWEDEANRTCLDVAAATGAQWVLDMYKRK